MKPVKVAQIGTGHDHASSAYSTMLRLSGCFDVVGLAEPVEEYKDRPLTNPSYKGAKLYTVDQLLQMDDLEAVVVEAGKEYSTAYAQMFADKGTAVFLDKPGTQDSASFEKLVRTMQSKALPFHMGYMYRYNPLIRRCFELVREGRLGEVYAVEAQMSVRHDPAKRQWLSRYKGGMMYFLGCHLVDLVYSLQGMPDEVLPLNTCVGSDGVTAEDYGFAVLKYPHGVSMIKTCGAEYNGFDRRQLVICGTRGTIELRPLECHTVGGLQTTGSITLEEFAPAQWADGSKPLSSGIVDRYEAMMRGFAKIVRGEAENPYSYDYELELFRLLMRCCGAE